MTTRSFVYNGPILPTDAPSRFLKVPTDAELDPVLQCIVVGGKALHLHGARQSGKTTLVNAAIARLAELEPDVLVLSITGEGLYGKLTSEGEAWTAINNRLAVASPPPVDTGTAAQHLVSDADWLVAAYGRRKTVLFFDEFDVLLDKSTCVQARDAVLHGLRSLLTRAHPTSQMRDLHALVVIGSDGILDMNTTGASVSPWNVETRHAVPPFLTSDLVEMCAEYTEQAGVCVASSVLDSAVAETGGHRGWCMLLLSLVANDIKARRVTGTYGDADWTDLSARTVKPTLTGNHTTVRAMKWAMHLSRGLALLALDVLGNVQSVAGSGGWSRSSEFGTENVVQSRLLREMLAVDVLWCLDGDYVSVGPVWLLAVIRGKLRGIADLRVVAGHIFDADLPNVFAAVCEDALSVVAAHWEHSHRVSQSRPELRVPQEACYWSALKTTMECRLSDAVVTFSANAGSTVPKIDLIAHAEANGVKWVVEVVCHERKGGATRGGSVAEHAVRVNRDYAPHFPGYAVWLVNFDHSTEPSKDAVLGAADLSFHRVNIRWSGDVASGIVLHSTSYWAPNSDAKVRLFPDGDDE